MDAVDDILLMLGMIIIGSVLLLLLINANSIIVEWLVSWWVG